MSTVAHLHSADGEAAPARAAINPLHIKNDWRSTANNCADVLRCLEGIALDQLGSKRAEYGLFLIHQAVAEALDAIVERDEE